MKKKISTRKWLIPYIVLGATTFTVVAIWLQYNGVELSSTLIACVFTFLGGELGLSASITKAKVRNDYYYMEEEVEEEEGEEG